MRRILINHANKNLAQKRGGDSHIVTFNEEFMSGSSSQMYQNLLLGFRDNTRLTESHQLYKLDANTATDFTAFNVLTFQFSQSDGMTIYVKGELTASGADATKTNPLSAYLGVRIGSQNGIALQIAEIRAYGTAVNSEQRKYVVDQLLTKYSL